MLYPSIHYGEARVRREEKPEGSSGLRLHQAAPWLGMKTARVGVLLEGRVQGFEFGVQGLGFR